LFDSAILGRIACGWPAHYRRSGRV